MGRRIDRNGSTPVYLGRSAEIFGTTDGRPLTVNVWHRPESLSPSTGTLFANEMVGAPSLAIISDAGVLKFYSGSYGSVVTASLSTLITVDTWNMFTLTWAANNDYRLYINGVERAAGSLARTYTSTTGNSILGNLNGNENNFFAEGDYAEFAAWDSVLSGSQISSLYTGAESGVAANTVGTPAHYAPLLGTTSPEPETVGGGSWTLTGTVPASTTIGSSPAHPNISGGNTATPAFGRYGVRGPVR